MHDPVNDPQPDDSSAATMERFSRQTVFQAWGPRSQEALGRSRALLVGCGGLGTWTSELLVRAGIGFLRLVDDDIVSLTNLHRQALYGEDDAAARRFKVAAAVERLRRLNRHCRIDVLAQRLDRFNIHAMARDVDLVLDGTDNFATRFLLNDYGVRHGKPWVFAGVVRSELQVMTILPGRTACLRCVLESPPLTCVDPNCREVGVLGPAVSVAASLQAMEAMKILAGQPERCRPELLKMDLWDGAIQRLRMGGPRTNPPCRCCVENEFEYLEP